MTESQLLAYLKLHYPKENESCEWKSFANLTHNVSAHKGEDIISYVSSIANMSGGHLVIGVEDKTLALLGIQNFHDYTDENLPPRLIGNCTNLSSEGLRVESFVTSDTHKTIWVIHIPKHLARKPVYAHKTAWQRKGDNLIVLTKEREEIILQEPIHHIDDWSAVICEEATLDDLDDKAIAVARDNFKSKFPSLSTEADTWDNITFLNKAKVTIKGKITRTAIILLGKSESEHFINPSEVKIRWILKDKSGNERDYSIHTCPFLLAVDEVYAKIRNLKYRYMKPGTLFPEEVDQYEPFVIREAINNCIAHQDYTKAGRINVVERDDELLFTNLGNFIPGSIDKVIRENAPAEFYRNPFLTHAMFNLKMVDTIGSGIRKMFNFQRNRFFPMPEYAFDGRVSVNITGKVLDMDYARVLAQNPDLNLGEIIMLDKVQKRKELLPDELEQLKKKGLIEGRKPNFHISARIADSTDQRADYILSKGMDDDYCKKLIEEYLTKFKEGKREDFEKMLFKKLPGILTEEQKKHKVKNFLQALKNEGKIELVEGKTWVLSKYLS